MYLEFECSDMVDAPDNIECAFSEVGDSTSEVENMLNDMSLDELYELRDSLTEGDISDTESDADNEIPVVSDMMPLEDELTSDSTNEVDAMLNNMSLEELYALRDFLTEGDASDAEGEFPDVSDMMPLEDKVTSDYSFHWDTSPKHNTDWDEDLEPTDYADRKTR